MGKIVKITIAIFLVLAILLTVSLAIAAAIFNELLLIYQCSVISAHLLLITILAYNVIDLDTNTKGDKE